MGVSGSGKSTVGAALARALKWPFFDGDRFHSEDSVAKMAAGQPLTDDDRAPWLQRIHNLVSSKLAEGNSVVVACSALKQTHRDKIRGKLKDVQFVYLKGDHDLIRKRLQKRSDHFMDPSLLDSQFDALEEPIDAVVVDISKDLDTLVLDTLLGLAVVNL
jgi:gluconokinase